MAGNFLPSLETIHPCPLPCDLWCLPQGSVRLYHMSWLGQWYVSRSGILPFWSRSFRRQLKSPALAGGFFTTSTTWEALGGSVKPEDGLPVLIFALPSVRRKQPPTPVFWPGESHGLGSPWVAKSQTRLSSPWVAKSQTRLNHIHFTVLILKGVSPLIWVLEWMRRH